LLRPRGCYAEQLAVAPLGIVTARAHRDRSAEARMPSRTGQALTQLGQPSKAIDHLHREAHMFSRH
jgi:hypothetical protein